MSEVRPGGDLRRHVCVVHGDRGHGQYKESHRDVVDDADRAFGRRERVAIPGETWNVIRSSRLEESFARVKDSSVAGRHGKT
jgi:hypothetical protein